ncbi:putative cysteine-rich receptor-like protein kinase 9 [Spinacia oleracea]|uniref:Cysteine-rich receptor-like protein kinase 9 n=1 Tax=Spinacia oleracea TaxID=3562 RepID=A0ABM3QX26_SPIOL|nr:putative cysteine-rich receptor-like protein kinase 9 [Spinacia oleracea]
MKTNRVLFACILLSFLFFKSASAENKVNYLQSYCYETGHYIRGSEYQNSLELVLSNLTLKAKTNKFHNYNTTVIHDDQKNRTTKVYGLFLCNSAMSTEICQHCVMIASGEIQTRCPSNVQSIIWYLECMLWYANVDVFSKNNVDVFFNYPLNADRENYGEFNNQWIETFVNLFNKATTTTTTSGNNSTSLMSAFVDVAVTGDVTLGSYVECTPNLSPLDCRKCLQTGLGRLPKNGVASGVLLQPSCRLMYAFNSSRILKSPAQAPSNQSMVPTTNSKGIYIAAGLISAVAAVAVLMNVFLCLKIRRKSDKKPNGKFQQLHKHKQIQKWKISSNILVAITQNDLLLSLQGCLRVIAWKAYIFSLIPSKKPLITLPQKTNLGKVDLVMFIRYG